MTIVRHGDTLHVGDIGQLDASHAADFRAALDLALPSGVKQIEIDLAQTDFLDCCGVGALVGLRNAARRCAVRPRIQLHNPTGAVERVFQLTGLNQLFPVYHDEPCPRTISRAE